MSKISFLMRGVDSVSDPKTSHRISPATELIVETETETPRVISSPSLAKQPSIQVSTTSSFGRLTIRVIEGSDLPVAKMAQLHDPAPSSNGWVKSLRRSSLTARKSTPDSKTTSNGAINIMVHIGGEAHHLYSTDCILAEQDSWNEEFMLDCVSSEEVLILYGIDRMQQMPNYNLPLHLEEHVGCIGKVCIPLSRLPENEEIEQWYSFTGNTSTQTFTRTAIRVSLKYSPSAIPVPPSSPHHHQPRHPSFIGHPSSDPSTHVDEDDVEKCENHTLPSGILDYILIVGPNAEHDNVVLQRYPFEDRTDFPLPTKIEWFCFPGGYEVVVSETRPQPKEFTFVLSGGADGLSKCYGACVLLYEAGEAHIWHPYCLCILSRVPLLDFMKESCLSLAWIYSTEPTQIDNYFHDLTTTLPRPIRGLVNIKCTIPGHIWNLELYKHVVSPLCTKSLSNEYTAIRLPSIPYSMRVFFHAFPLTTIIQMVILALCEYRLVVHSTNISLLCPVTETLKALLYPFRWQNPYVPMLPKILSEYLQAPLPYILGVNTSWLSSLFEGGRPEHLVLIDIDRGTIAFEGTTPPPLPIELTRELYDRLKSLKAEEWSLLVEHNIRLAFVSYLTTMINGYRDCLFFVNSSFPVFNKRRFLANSVPSEMTPLVTKLLTTQTFETFLENHSSHHLDAFHSIYTLLCQTQEQTWLESPSELFHQVEPVNSIKISLPTPTSIPLLQEDLMRSLQSLNFKLKLCNPSKRTNASRVWTLHEVAMALDLEEDVLEEAIQSKSTHGDASNTLHRQLSSEEEKVEQSIHKCLVSIFSSDEGIPREVKEACEMSFKAQYARELFVLILMQPHHKGHSSEKYNPKGAGSCLGEIGFHHLVELATVMLEQCKVHEDFTNARGLLQVSAQFYRIVESNNQRQQGFGAKREYLQQSLKSQTICRSLDMWHHAFSRDIEAAIKSDQETTVSDDLFFSQMGSLVYDMLNVDVPVSKVHTFVSGMCSTYSKDKEVLETLAQLVENLHRALVLSTDSVTSTHQSWALTPDVTTSTKQYDLDTVIRRKLSNVSQVSSSSDDGNLLITAHSPILSLAVHGEHVAAGCLNGTMHLYSRDAITQLDGHTGPISQVQIRGHALISSSYDSTIRVWNMQGGDTSPKRNKPFLRFMASETEECHVLRGHTAPIVSLELGKQLAIDRILVASGSWDKSIRIWDSSKDTSLLQLQHTSAVQCLKFVAASATLVSGDKDAGLDVWDVHGGRKKSHFTAHRSSIKDLQIAGDRLVSASNDRCLKVWDVHFRSGQCCTHVLMGHSGPVSCVALGGPADPTICSGSADGVVKVWDLRLTGKGARLELTGHGGRVTVLHRDFTKVISGSEDGTLRVWNMHTGVCGQILPGHLSGLTGLGSQDPNLLSASWDGTVRVWDVNIDV